MCRTACISPLLFHGNRHFFHRLGICNFNCLIVVCQLSVVGIVWRPTSLVNFLYIIRISLFQIRNRKRPILCSCNRICSNKLISTWICSEITRQTADIGFRCDCFSRRIYIYRTRSQIAVYCICKIVAHQCVTCSIRMTIVIQICCIIRLLGKQFVRSKIFALLTSCLFCINDLFNRCHTSFDIGIHSILLKPAAHWSINRQWTHNHQGNI